MLIAVQFPKFRIAARDAGGQETDYPYALTLKWVERKARAAYDAQAVARFGLLAKSLQRLQ
jgi:hypothetical protein